MQCVQLNLTVTGFVAIFFLIFSISTPRMTSAIMVDRPRDAVAMLRRRVLFRCSVSDHRDSVEWFFQSRNAKVRLWKTPGLKHRKYFDTFEILGSYDEEADIRYDLLIKRVQMEHTGSFVCTVTTRSNKTTRSARLSILDVEECRTYFVDDVLGHKCRLHSSGHHNFTIYWNCAHEAIENITSSFYMVKNLLSDRIRVQVSVLTVIMNMRGWMRMTACRMDIQSRDLNDAVIVDENGHLDPFSISVYQLSPLSSILLENYTETCAIGDRGEIFLDMEIVFQESYQYFHQLEMGNVKELLSYTCEILRYSSTNHMPTLDMKYLNASCEYMGGLKCLRNFTFLLRTESDVFQLSRRQHEFLCDNLKTAEECLWFFQPCLMNKKMTGYIESYKALCSQEYLAIKKPFGVPNIQRCFDQYPQRIELIYKNAKIKKPDGEQSQTLPKPPNTFASQFCAHMATLTGYFCAEHSLASDGYADFGIWYLKFVRMYRQISLGSFVPTMRAQDGIQRETDCESLNSGSTVFKHCVVAQTCSGMFSLLLRSLHFGLVIIKEFHKFTQELCTSDVIFMKNCVNELFHHCDLMTYSTYRSLAYLADDICVRFIDVYPKYHDCFLGLYTHADISKHCMLSDLLQSTNSYKSDPTGLATQLCVLGMKYLNCMEVFVKGICGHEAASVQKWLLKDLFATAFEELYCRDLFQQKEWGKLRSRGFARSGSPGKDASMALMLLRFIELFMLLR